MSSLLKVLFFVLIGSLAQAETVDRLIAIVNTEAVLESDYRRLQELVKRKGVLQQLLLQGKQQSAFLNNRKASMEYLVNERLMDSEIKRLNMSVTQERVNQEMRDKARQNHMSVADLMKAVSSQGMTESEYQAFVKTNIEWQSLVESEIISKIHIADDDLLSEYLRKYPNNTGGVYEYTVSHIVFSSAKPGGEPAALSRAQSALAKLKSGEVFEEVAEQRSEDANFSAGGSLGTVKAGELAKEMDHAVSLLQPGQISDVVRVQSGKTVRFHILKLAEKKVVSDPRFEREKGPIRAGLMEKLFSKHFRDWLEAKKEDAFIRVNRPS